MKAYIVEDVVDLMLIDAYEEESGTVVPDEDFYKLSWMGKIALNELSYFLFAINHREPYWPIEFMPEQGYSEEISQIYTDLSVNVNVKRYVVI